MGGGGSGKVCKLGNVITDGHINRWLQVVMFDISLVGEGEGGEW